MKRKQFLSLLLAAVLMLTMAPAALAAQGEADSMAKLAADTLNALGLFSGTGTDENGDPIYELERQPTRQEAVTMLVKLLGGADKAAQGGWETPFTDVDDWAKNWVGYAYHEGLTAGTSATTFGANDKVTAAQYLTFILKALGYSATEDFQWDKAWELSDQIGLTYGEYGADSDFTRGDVAIISLNALSLRLKSGDKTLMDLMMENKTGGKAEDAGTTGVVPGMTALAAFIQKNSMGINSWGQYIVYSRPYEEDSGITYTGIFYYNETEQMMYFAFREQGTSSKGTKCDTSVSFSYDLTTGENGPALFSVQTGALDIVAQADFRMSTYSAAGSLLFQDSRRELASLEQMLANLGFRLAVEFWDEMLLRLKDRPVENIQELGFVNYP